MFCAKIAIVLTVAIIICQCVCDDPTQQRNTHVLSNDIFNTNDGDWNSNYEQNQNPNQNEIPTVLNQSPQPGKYKSCGNKKECVPRYLCQDGSIKTDGANIIDIRIGDAECAYLETCCDISNKRGMPVIDPVPPETHNGCGFRNPDGVGFLITGDKDNESQFGEFPWMVAVLREEETAGEILYMYQCGGALIAPNAIITASHCVSNRKAEELIVRAGEWDTQSKAEVLPEQDQNVKEIIVHEQYNRGALYNDVAILILDGYFDWAENIRPVCLPPNNINFDHTRCFATGWGKDKFGNDGQYQVILKKINLPVMPHSTCQTNLRTTRLGKYFKLHDSFICAGGEAGIDTCTGDGGSPLVCPVPGVKDRFYHAGIVAWGIGCGERNIPGVYASVPYLRPWIDNKLMSRGIDFQHFTP